MNNVENIMARWTPDTRRYYEKRGYVFSSYDNYFYVKSSDFSAESKMPIRTKCSCCGDYFDDVFRNYDKRIRRIGVNLCKNCLLEKKRDKLYSKVVEACDKKQYVLLTQRDEIVNTTTPIVYMCPKHGVTNTTVRSLTEGKGCVKCGRELAAIKAPETTLERRRKKLYKDAIEAAEKHGYTLLSKEEEIINNMTYIQYLCPKHGLHTMRISNFINGKGCPDCVPEENSERFRLSPDEVERRVSECGGRLLNKEEYKNQTEKNLWIECFECGKPFVTSLRNFTQHGGQVCSNCKSTISMGEYKIKQYLEHHDINFIFQKWFADCRDVNPLPFDFYLINDNTIIEFDGRQHFEETELFTYPLEMVQRHDRIKNNYCYEHNIKLIRIPYWEMNKIEIILDNKLILHEDIV